MSAENYSILQSLVSILLKKSSSSKISFILSGGADDKNLNFLI